MGSHAAPCAAPNQHQQQDQAEPESSRGEATQQREIDGVCSQMRSASLRFVRTRVCVRMCVCVGAIRGMEGTAAKKAEERNAEARGTASLLWSLHN